MKKITIIFSVLSLIFYGFFGLFLIDAPSNVFNVSFFVCLGLSIANIIVLWIPFGREKNKLNHQIALTVLIINVIVFLLLASILVALALNPPHINIM